MIVTWGIPCVIVSNVLSDDKKQQVIAVGRLGWSLRRIETALHIRREKIGGYLRAAGIAIRARGAWGRRTAAKPANEVITDFGADRAVIPKGAHSHMAPATGNAPYVLSRMRS